MTSLILDKYKDKFGQVILNDEGLFELIYEFFKIVDIFIFIHNFKLIIDKKYEFSFYKISKPWL